MIISFYGGYFNFLRPIIYALEENGHLILFNKFSKNTELVIVQSHTFIYEIYKILKKVKENNVKMINIILDIPPWRLENNFYQNSKVKYLQQMLFDSSHKNIFLKNIINILTTNNNKRKIQNSISKVIKKSFNNHHRNKVFYQINYRNFLKNSDLNLSISMFTQKLVKTFLNVNSEVWYPGVNTNLIEKIPRNSEPKYDAINISRIVYHKRQELFVKAAKALGLKIAVIGPYQDKTIKLDCLHYYLKDHESVLKELSKSKFYVDASLFEGFGLTPIEAAFLDKISIVSDTYVHREVLENYPLYFMKNNLNDLIEKMKMVLAGDFSLDNEMLERIKKKYSLKASKDRLLNYIESL
jgi:glycosyltransferase involved in cell wall biosynthesis